MKHSPAVSSLALFLAAWAGAVAADQTVAVFDGGIGSQPLAAGAATNDVNGVAPGGRPWEIRKLQATVKFDGREARIVVQGEGLILGGGGNVGIAGANRRVAATFFCGAVGSGPTMRNTFNSDDVAVTIHGDFEIKSKLHPATPDDTLNRDNCDDPAGARTPGPPFDPPPILLIRTVGAPGGAPGAWFAAGIPKGLPEVEEPDDD